MNKGGNCGRPGEEPCSTGEVVITIPKPNGPKANPHLYLPGANPGSGDPGVIDGNCGAYGNCGGGGGGYGENQNDPNNNDSCGKTKKQKSNPDYRAKINVLESNLDLKKETGFIEKNDGTFHYKDNANATEDANTLSLPDPNIFKDIKGFMHTHPNNFEDSNGNMRIGFKIFSPGDVIYFNKMVKNAKDNGKPLDEVYAVMVSGNVTYQIRFTGDPNQIKTIYTNTEFEYREMYKSYFQQNSKRSDDLNFLKFIDEVMNVRGITLVELNEDGVPPTMKTLNSNKDGVAKAQCPQ
ncbi:hypothetical protein [Chryseobacterium kwangjuense]|uniref:Uncharacterized protein n=1 Tax=Chryseobacterium kwangjuense TaxID=267125 RepID=A0A135WI60_9FLAO|nr:hypothetical protein [Chryseobacterium kwangjuense]KXH84581.1 hypothetical protein AU378_02105 [Chryseobacterium kwangjuense]